MIDRQTDLQQESLYKGFPIGKFSMVARKGQGPTKVKKPLLKSPPPPVRGL